VNEKVYLFGALDAQSDRLLAGFWARKDSDAFVEFLRDLLHHIPHGQLCLILDNYIIHHSARTHRFLASPEAQRITLVFLPTYAPWLNRIEMTWRHLKARAATNQWRDTLDLVQDAFCQTMNAMGATTLRRATALPTSKD
jgi:transposase